MIWPKALLSASPPRRCKGLVHGLAPVLRVSALEGVDVSWPLLLSILSYPLLSSPLSSPLLYPLYPRYPLLYPRLLYTAETFQGLLDDQRLWLTEALGHASTWARGAI